MKEQSLYEKILNKPKSYRRRLSYALTAVIGVLIFTIWIIITTFSMKEAFNFEDNETESIGESISNEFNAPSFYEEEDMKLLEDNFETLMNQTEEQENLEENSDIQN